MTKAEERLRALPAAEQVEEVRTELKNRNPGFDGSVTHKIEGGVVTELSIDGENVNDISSVRVLVGVKVLGFAGGPLSELRPLRGMPLTSLKLESTQVWDRSPLRGMPLTSLDLSFSQMRDLEQLTGMKLNSLFIYGTGITDLKPLQGMLLEEIRLTPRNITQGLASLRDMRSLKTIGIAGLPHEKWSAAEFWERYDKGEFTKERGGSLRRAIISRRHFKPHLTKRNRHESTSLSICTAPLPPRPCALRV